MIWFKRIVKSLLDLIYEAVRVAVLFKNFLNEGSRSFYSSLREFRNLLRWIKQRIAVCLYLRGEKALKGMWRPLFVGFIIHFDNKWLRER